MTDQLQQFFTSESMTITMIMRKDKSCDFNVNKTTTYNLTKHVL